MTLEQWSAKYGFHVSSHAASRLVFADDVLRAPMDCRLDLFRLSDYLVSSCSGGMYWLTLRPSWTLVETSVE